MNKENVLTLTPLENYQAPDLPTYEGDQPDLTKKMPRRWKDKAIATATAGLLGIAPLASCGNADHNTTPIEVPSWSALNEHGQCWMHHGGSGGAPLYVAYLTEQEAIGIVRAELESAGISFTENTPPYSVEIDDTEEWGQVHQVGINLFNEEHTIGLSIVEPDAFHIPFWRFEMDEVSKQIERGFEENHPDLSVGLFCNPSSWIGWWEPDWDEDGVPEEEKTEAREMLIANLVDQTQDFIELLREEGVLE